MKLIGGDICKDRVVCWLLTEVPSNLKDFWRSERKARSKDPQEDPMTYYFNRGGVKGLLELEPDAIVLEPTGVHYAWLLAHICEKEGIEVRWIGHQEAVYYRRQNRLPDKNDLADALAIAAYGLTHWARPEMFIRFEPGKTVALRESYLQLKSLARIQSPIVNRLRQQLAREFPEAALMKTKRASDGLAPLFAWIAGKARPGKRGATIYQQKYDDSLAVAYGVDLSDFSRHLASLLCDLHAQETLIEQRIASLLAEPEFAPYRRVFDRFAFGHRLQALLLSQIYPFGRYEQMGRFKRRIGAAQDEESSGDVARFRPGSGSKLCRSEMYLWCLTAIAPRIRRPTSEVGSKICKFYDRWKEQLQNDPDKSKRMALHASQRRAVAKMKRDLTDSLGSLIQKEALDLVVALVESKASAFGRDLDSDLSDQFGDTVKGSEARKGFGNLIIGKTCGYSARLLFRELRRELGSVGSNDCGQD